MDEKNKEKENKKNAKANKKESADNFKAVKKSNFTSYAKKASSSPASGFGKTVVIPFFCGVLGCAVVLGTCFGVPSIKNKIFEATPSNKTPSSSNKSSEYSGYVDQASLSAYSDTSIYAANKILPSIVGISVEYTVNSGLSLFSSRQQTAKAEATGSGIIISEDGYILTNNHIVSSTSSESYYVVSDANKVTVKLYNDDTEYEGKIVGKDEQTDLAVIKIDKSGLTKAEFADSDSVKVGEFAMAVGNPLGLDSSITCGVISAVNREVKDSDGKSFTLIQTDAAINSGNSGGALVNSEGEVIGINTLKVSGTGIEGMGFAIPINSTVDITSELIQYNKVKRPYIGITGVDLNEKIADAYNLVVGIYVRSVEEFSAAEKAGIKAGDVIIEADGKKVTSMDELNEIKNKKQINDEIKLKINRDNDEKEITVKLGEQP